MGKQLSAKKQRMRLEYRKDFNAAQAALRAGYARSTAEKQAPLWVGKNRDSCPPAYRDLWDAAQEDMRRCAARAEVTAERILRESDACGLVDPLLFVDADGAPLPLHQAPEEARRALAGFEVTETVKDGVTTRRWKYRLTEKTAALTLSAKARGMFREDAPQAPGNEGGVVVHMHLGRQCADCPYRGGA